ncbi:MAG: hypothetical protein E7624_02875 [Ruminococcaceae bacterium]|nr:hypothetical protein [Oscillospiraceae bacterium]
MKTRTHRTPLALAALTVLFFVLALGATLLPASAADVTPAAATQITAQNLASFEEKGATEAHIGYYAIETLPHLYWYAQQVNGGDNEINAVLLADLTLNEKVLNADGTLIADTSALQLWAPINNPGYDGTFDGNGHVLRGFFTGNTELSYGGDGSNALFATVHAATICNLGIEDSYFGAWNQYKASSFIGSAYGSAYLENCYSTATILGQAYCGGLVGKGDATTIKNCYFAGKITADDYTSAAIISDLYDDGTLINCYYLEGCGLSTKRATAVTAAQLAGGMLTVRLNGGVTDGTQAFYQTVGVGHPTLSGATVYASAPCVSQFSNDPAAIGTIEHSVSAQWTFDDVNHWHACVLCDERFDVTPHTFDSTGACTSCEYQATFQLKPLRGGILYLGDDLVALEKQLQSGDRIKLLRDYVSDGYFIVSHDVQDFIFDINGHIWNVYTIFHNDGTVTDSSEGMQGAVDGAINFYGGSASSTTLVLKNLRFVSEGGAYLYTDGPQSRILLDNVVIEDEASFPEGSYASIVIKNACFKNGLSAPVAIETLLLSGAELVDAKGDPITLTAGQSTLQGEFFVVSYAFSVTSAEGTTRYKSVEELSAALKNMSGNVTITLLCDTDGDGAELSVRSGTVAVLDLAGKHLQNAYLSPYQGSTLTLTDSSEAKSGRYTQPFGITGLCVLGTMILQGGYIDSNIVLYHESSVLYVEGGIYALVQISLPAGAHVEITGGRFEKMLLSNGVTFADVIPEGYLPYGAQGWIGDLGGSVIEQPFEIRAHVHENAMGKDETHHWVGCACGLLAEGGSREEHQYNENGVCSVCEHSTVFRFETKDGETLFFATADALSAYVEDSNGGRITVLADTEELSLRFLSEGEWVIDLSGASVSLLDIFSSNADVTLTDSAAPATGEGKKSDVVAQMFGGTLRVESGCYSACMLAYNSLYTSVTVEVSGGSFDFLSLYGGEGEVYVNGGVAKTLEIRSEDSDEAAGSYMDPPKINCFEVTEELVFTNATMTLFQLLPLPGCVTLTDGEGNPVTLPNDSGVYVGHLIFTHSDTHVGPTTQKADDHYHWQVYPCGAKTEKAAHYGGTASCHQCAICEGCGLRYGELALHDFDEGLVCRVCEATAKLALTTPDGLVLYGDLVSAFAAAQRAEHATVTLLCDVTGNENDAVLEAGNVTLDLAGFLLETGIIQIGEGATLTVTDTGEERTGKITASYAFEVLEGGTLIVNGGEINASSALTGGNATVNGGVFTGLYGFDLYNSSTLIVNGGEFYCEEEDFYVSGRGSTLVLRGGTFPEGLLIVDYSDDPLSIVDALAPFTCFSFVDAEGNPITLEEEQVRYADYIRVLHTESYTLQKDADVHYEVCVCGEKRNEAAHSGGAATCTEQAICETCGESYGALAAHEYDNACDGKCNVCEEDTRTPAAHSGGTATCTEKAKCASCGESYGELAAHVYDNACDGKCNVCGADTRTPAAHKDANKDNKCDACGTAMQTGDPAADEEGLSGGAVAAIVIGSVAVLGGGGFALYWFVLRKKRVI